MLCFKLSSRTSLDASRRCTTDFLIKTTRMAEKRSNQRRTFLQMGPDPAYQGRDSIRRSQPCLGS